MSRPDVAVERSHVRCSCRCPKCDAEIFFSVGFIDTDKMGIPHNSQKAVVYETPGGTMDYFRCNACKSQLIRNIQAATKPSPKRQPLWNDRININTDYIVTPWNQPQAKPKPKPQSKSAVKNDNVDSYVNPWNPPKPAKKPRWCLPSPPPAPPPPQQPTKTTPSSQSHRRGTNNNRYVYVLSHESYRI